MLAVGDIHIYVSDFTLALRFYEQGLGLTVIECEATRSTAYARLDFPDGGPSIRLFGHCDPWPAGTRPDPGERPTVRFDIMTTEFETVLARLVEFGGSQAGEIEVYEALRAVTVADPDGNTFELLELPAEEDAPDESDE